MDERRLILLMGMLSAGAVIAVLFGRYAISLTGLLVAVGLLVLGVVFFRGVNTEGLTTFQTAFFLCYIVVLLATWSPLKFFAYLSPVVFLACLILILSVSGNSVILRRTMGLLFLWAIITFFYLAINRDFVTQNSIIAFFTYASIFPIVLIPSKWLAGQSLHRKIVTVTVALLTFEAVYGIAQGIFGLVILGNFVHAAGDFVDGTIHPGPYPSGRFDNPLFALNMAFGLVLIAQQIAVERRREYVIPFMLCAAAFVMAAVVHLVLVFLIATLIALLIVRPRLHDISPQIRSVFGVAMLTVPLLTVVLLQSNFRSVDRRIDSALTFRNQKTALAKRVVVTMPRYYPQMWTVGLGPGQFSSRANLIAAGYLRRLPPPFEVAMTRSFEEHSLDLWIKHYGLGYTSAIERPASSWIAVLAEFGWLGAGLVVFLITRLMLSCRTHAKTTGQLLSGYFLCTGILFAFGAGAAEFYWETCQAIFVGLLILKVMHANFMFTEDWQAEQGDADITSSPQQLKRPQPERIRAV